MNKKANTILFILGATAFNVLIAISSFILLIVLYFKFIVMHIPENARAAGPTIILIGSLVISFFVYRAVLKLILAKIDVDKYFDPLFVRRNIKKQRD